MKRVILLILVISLTASLFSCGTAIPEKTEETAAATASAPAATDVTETAGVHDASGFAAGFSRVDITPKAKVPLAGYGRTSDRFYKKILDPITLTAIAVSDGETKALLITQDIIRSDEKLTTQARKMISQKTGVPTSNILFAGTHTHSSVDPNSSDGSVDHWKTIYYKQILAACEEAIADLDSATLEIGRIETEGLTYVRRYYLKDGTHLGDNSGTSATEENPIDRHESEADQEMQLIRFVRKNQPDIVLANFQGHPTITGGSTKYDLSADYVYPFRKNVEEELGVKCAFFLGSSGNQNTNSRIESERTIRDYLVYGKELAGYAVEGLEKMQPVGTGKILSDDRTYTAATKKHPFELVKKAEEIVALWQAMKTDEAKALCRQYGISSPYAASAVIASQSYADTYDIECCALSFGDVSFITAGYEMFSTIQLAIKAATPYKMTFILTCSQEKHGYMPTADVFPNGGYEVDTCRYVAGTAEALRDTYLEQLDLLYSER
jgi:hypothetical protein